MLTQKIPGNVQNDNLGVKMKKKDDESVRQTKMAFLKKEGLP